MIYLPYHLDRYWTWDDNQPLSYTKFTRGLGFYSHQPVQMTFLQTLDAREIFILGALRCAEPMEHQVLRMLDRIGHTRSELDYWVHDSDPHYHAKSDCTLDTAIRRLLKAGKISRKLHSRGWYRYYVYSLKGE